MELLGVIVVFIFFINLRQRVDKLEQLIQSGLAKNVPASSREAQIPQLTPVPPGLLDYIREQLGQGVSIEEIRKSLVARGWQTGDIDRAFNLVNQPSIQTVAAVVQTGSTPSDKFIKWLKEEWLLKLGALLLLIGFGWLTTYAFLNNWIGPMGRIALGIVAGTLFLLLGWWRIKKYSYQGGVFLVLGSTTILLTIFAAREIYNFFTPFTALAVMFLSTALVAFVSVRYNRRSLSLASLVLAGVAPLLTNAPTANYAGLFSYLFVVVIGAIWITVLTGRRELTTAALILVTFYSLPHLFSFVSTDRGILLLFAYAFAAVFFLTNTAGILKLKGKEILPDLVTAAGNGLFLLSWIMVAAQDEWKSLIISAWMVVFAVGAFLIFRITQRREPLYVYASVGMAMLAAATSAELKGETLTIAYTIESGMISLVAYTILKDIRVACRVNLLLAGSVMLSLGSLTSPAWSTGVLHKDFFVLLVLGLTLAGLGLYYLRHLGEATDAEPRQLNRLYLIVGSLYVYALLWLSLHAVMNDNVAVMISLVVYTVIGLFAYFWGLANDRKIIQFYGGALVGFVVVRLLLVDIWKMELAGRIVTFFLIGTLLISTAFVGKKRIALASPDGKIKI